MTMGSDRRHFCQDWPNLGFCVQGLGAVNIHHCVIFRMKNYEGKVDLIEILHDPATDPLVPSMIGADMKHGYEYNYT